MEDWTAIAAEVAAAIDSVGFAATLQRATARQATPYDTPAATPGATFAVTVLDDGVKDRYAPGSMIVRRVRVLTIGAVGVVPAMSDTITVRGVAHRIEAVLPLAPGGADLLYEVEIAA